MHDSTQHLKAPTRRNVLKSSAALALAPFGITTTSGLTLMASAAAQTATDYKALVCVFLFGANDHYNTVIPYDLSTHNAYFNIRKGESAPDSVYNGIAIPRDALAGTVLNTSLSGGIQFALNPEMSALKSVFESKRASIVLNIGPLIVPTTRRQFDNKSVPLPPKLFSHNDQQAYWQSSFQTEGGVSGWGGRAADLLMSNNARSTLTCISVNGNALFLSGQQAISYQLSSTGATTVNAVKNKSLFGSSACANALQVLMTQPSAIPMANDYTVVTKRALDTYDGIVSAIGTAPSASMNAWFPSSSSNTLSAQLKIVARLIEQQAVFGMKRQVFMVGMGGFDLHDFLPTQHPGLLQKLSVAMKEFDDAMINLGKSSQVTTFTASDFGRTLASNGDGSDHGWGAHHFVMGGAVDGGKYAGVAPEIGLNHNEQVGGGRLLPSTSVDQFGAEVGAWFGVSKSDISTVLPNARYFDLYKLGLFKS
ncbi:MAG: DUF1501 domain-containing protein [Betaproteobacteria bacterium]|nr:DUF1501 domain-containing protein [Betaproteobacteria bacterium]NBP39824.1 DUF1501 domain-containing protein [Betaproteobacteria bacterium]NBQ80957.1 DUF1501 domain-containing protein [Betaproteobacteria bacterium]NBS20666.1 DUF1501 domain-containing protein [Betaproteobacteria bacterium]NBT64386.1 DUF1501 domain-containing protein [Betaproteobacteria bacterium]